MPVINDYIPNDTVLTQVSLAFKNEDYVFDRVFPRLTVAKKLGIYYKYDKAMLKVEDAKRTGLARAARVDFGLSKVTYGPLTERSLEEPIEYDVRDQYPSEMDYRVDATMNVTERMSVSLEYELATTLTNTANVTQNTTLSGTSQWSDFVNSDPRSDIQTAVDTIQGAAIKQANTLLLGYQVFSKLKLHPDLLGSLSVANIKVLTPELLSAILGIPEIIIAKAMYNSAVEGQTDSLSYIWGKNALLFYKTATPGQKQITAGYTLTLQDGRYVDRWDEPQVKAEFVRVNDYLQFVIMATEAMYLVKNAVA